jgi:HEAT repeat protein
MKPRIPEVVPALQKALREGKTRMLRPIAAMSLGMLGHEAKATVPDLIAALEVNGADPQETYWLHLNAIKALGRIGPDAKDAVSPLIAIATKEIDAAAEGTFLGAEVDLYKEAIEGLGKVGPQAQQAIPSLKKLTLARDRRIRESAVKAIDRIEGKK